MSVNMGIIILMGSGELTTTMVEVHKEVLAALGDSPKAVFMDTPAGFQLNCDQISQRAVEYFRTHVRQNLSVASYKSKEATTTYDAELAFHALREAQYVLIGPGSPTYAIRQLQHTPIPEILVRRIESGGCLVAASAAALTVGGFTLPVYEIYKVGQDPHWVEGMNLLGHFGFDLVVIPHWNNAEGGTHDTRFCFMGEPRFRMLESLLPAETSILGLDEHTACIIDLKEKRAEIKGIGRMTIRHQGTERVFERGDRFSLEVLRGHASDLHWKPSSTEPVSEAPVSGTEKDSLWDKIHGLAADFHEGLEKRESKGTTNALLELDRVIWKAQQDLESEEFISQAREILRDLLVLLGMRLESSAGNARDYLAPIVEELLGLRENFRRQKQWQEADAIRQTLQRTNIVVEDTQDGSRWHLGPD
jgi:hypothetical protein